ncbi:MAG: rhomboid family intramembrane serine protease [Anaerolineales bacterium]|jgi:rhomboid protease GluP
MNEVPPPEQSPQPRYVQVAMPNSRPVATYTLLALTTFIYILQFLGQVLNADIVTALGIKDDALIRYGQLWRLITPVFLHASILHIAFNMYALFLFGRGIEARFGHRRFLLLYFLSAFAGNVFSFLLTPEQSLGASTAIFGLLAAEAVFLIQNRQLLGRQVNRSLLNLLFIAAINLLFGITPGSGVDNFGHLGGILGGIIFTWFGGPRWHAEGIFPSLHLVDEREGHGAVAGTIAVLLFFIPLAVLGWFWIVK